ncbi:scavenger receptor cysteine-rich type 1 protein M160 [Solea solea]|uniref:scavenger receptor cysteine-rich type 1 protein M160 n=1 Tax=Solea solea TaxID=90069 RepID=UPI00272CB74B|nr:scavenger receptor cysteine-rich type 1 protein M160 [Solea solea]
MWFLLVFIAHTELLLISHVHGKIEQRAGMRLILRGGQHPCHGHVEILYKNKWGIVGDQDWNRATEEVVCRSTQCGTPVEGATEDVPKPSGDVWLNEVKCNGTENHLFDCDYPGLGVSQYFKDTVKKIKCSLVDKIEISLDGFECAGALTFSVDGKKQPGYFCAENWGKEEADYVCESLGCGKSKEIAVHNWMIWKEFTKSRKMKLDCGNIQPLNNLWQCVTQESTECKHPASVICTGYERLQLRRNRQKKQSVSVCSGQLEMEEQEKWVPFKKNVSSPDDWCRQMNCGSSLSLNGTELTCSDSVRVVLMDRGEASRCYGTVHMEVNRATYSVCASTWTMKEAEVTCRELDCGKVISYEKKSTGPGIMDNVRCLGSESSLWHCQAIHDQGMKCSTTAYVVCAESLDVRLADAPGKCAGRVEVLYEGSWKQVSTDQWTDDNSDTVCRQIHCGPRQKSDSPEQQFGGSSGDFLTQTLNCSKTTSSISECFTQTSKKASGTEAVKITCDDHKVLILNNSCSGSVGIVSGNDIHWLSGSATTWTQESADAVCKQVHCGKALKFSAPNATADVQVWDHSYNCSSDATSLFDCDAAANSHDHKHTIANVTCSGTITVTMTNKCWGTVSVCLDGRCGGVCADSWTNAHSVELCQSLGCGTAIQAADRLPGQEFVMVKSLYKTKHTTSPRHYSFVMKSEQHVCPPAYVVCSGSVMPRFSISRDNCSGNLEVHSEGQWLPVCADALQQKQAQHTMCEQLQCGQGVNWIEYFGPKPEATRTLSKVQCSETGVKSLSACNISFTNTPCSLAGLICSDWRKIKASETCSGAVSVHSKGRQSAVAVNGWKETEGKRLCKDLRCGSFKSKKVYKTSQQLPFWNGSFRCGEAPKNIWDCENKSTSSSQREQLFIECEDEPRVTLSDKCNGYVTLNRRNVCYSNWNFKYAHLVCQEQKCGNAIEYSSSGIQPFSYEDYHVQCDDFHYKLGQCKRVQGKCDTGYVLVSCVGSVNFTTTETCGGKLLINSRYGLKEMCPLNLSMALMEKLCHEIGCDGYNNRIHTRENTRLKNLETALDCTDDHNDVKYCVTKRSCKGVIPAHIYCNGYKGKSDENNRKSSTSIVPIILAVGLCLALIIVIVIFIQICILKKVKNFWKNPEARTVSRKEIQFESGDYEEVSKNDDEEDSRVRYEAEVAVAENDPHSSYDDIDEAEKAQPLTSHPTQADTVTYEVDDLGENYDDIEAAPEISQTTAEVHRSPNPSGVGGAVAPPGTEQEEGDYVSSEDDEG